MDTPPTILSLCEYSGVWSGFYARAGYRVIRVDIRDGQDVRLLPYIEEKIYGIIAQPPCTHLAGSGARWWEAKGEGKLLEGLSIADSCLRMVAIYDLRDRLKFWVMENPVGRLSRYIGPPQMTFNPCDYGGWIDGGGDAYTKRTCLWGRFNPPIRKPVPALEGSKIHLMAPSEDRADKRSLAPEGFCRAFFEANHDPVYTQQQLFGMAG